MVVPGRLPPFQSQQLFGVALLLISCIDELTSWIFFGPVSSCAFLIRFAATYQTTRACMMYIYILCLSILIRIILFWLVCCANDVHVCCLAQDHQTSTVSSNGVALHGWFLLSFLFCMSHWRVSALCHCVLCVLSVYCALLCVNSYKLINKQYHTRWFC